MSEAKQPDISPNATRYRVGQRAGHYESFFVRANHPERPLAFWIRYTLFSPVERPSAAIGELWAIVFDGETGRHAATKTELPLAACRFGGDDLDVEVGPARLDPVAIRGISSSHPHRIEWNLTRHGGSHPLLLLPRRLYSTALPRAKSLVPAPLVHFNGSLRVDGRDIEVHNWVGSQNHNWGSRHTDLYAWGQVAGFDGAPDAFLEVATARLKFGRLWTPAMTLVVVRLGDEEIALNGLLRSLRAKGEFAYFRWHFRSHHRATKLEGTIEAPKDAFVGLRYGNPPGGDKTCLNTKIARCHLTVERNGRRDTLISERRAAFEILTDDDSHGVPRLF